MNRAEVTSVRTPHANVLAAAVFPTSGDGWTAPVADARSRQRNPLGDGVLPSGSTSHANQSTKGMTHDYQDETR